MDQERLRAASLGFARNVRAVLRERGLAWDMDALHVPPEDADPFEGLDASPAELVAWLRWTLQQSRKGDSALRRAAAVGMAVEVGMHEVSSALGQASSLVRSIQAAPGAGAAAADKAARADEAIGRLWRSLEGMGSLSQSRLRSSISGKAAFDRIMSIQGNAMVAHGGRVEASPAFLEASLPLEGGAAMPVLLNLVLNAWQWSSRGEGATPSIRLDAYVVELPPLPVEDEEPSPRTATVMVVEDNGPGVPEDERESIFRPFHSGRGSSGIGLYVCRRNLEAWRQTVVASPFPSSLGGAAFLLGPSEALDPAPSLPLDEVEAAAMDAVGVASAMAEGRVDSIERTLADEWGSACAAAIRLRLSGRVPDGAGEALLRAVEAVNAVLEGRLEPSDLRAEYAGSLDYARR